MPRTLTEQSRKYAVRNDSDFEFSTAAIVRPAVLVLPAVTSLHGPLAMHGRWLTRGRMERLPQGVEPLRTVLQQLRQMPPTSGLAALRYWGQTGIRPAGWLCAADPVYLEARLDHVRLHALGNDRLAADERRQLYAFLQAEFATETRSFECLDDCGYLKSGQPFATADASSGALDGREPDPFLPTGDDAREHDRQIGELQLLLHDAPVNRQRMEQGSSPANSLWFWGGGRAPEKLALALPPLIARCPLFQGCWRAAGGDIAAWPDGDVRSLPGLLSAFTSGFVAVLPDDAESLEVTAGLLAAIKRLLLRGRVRNLIVCFRDGCLLRLRQQDLFALWRGRAWPDPGGNPS